MEERETKIVFFWDDKCRFESVKIRRGREGEKEGERE